jgi:hypothetical protein
MSKGSALGATLHYKNSTYIPIVGLQDFDFPFGECAELDTTTHGSTKKEFEPGIIDGGAISAPLVWDDAATSHIWLLANIHTVKQFKYTPKDGTAVEFLALIESIEIANPLGTGPKLRTLTISVTDGTIA